MKIIIIDDFKEVIFMGSKVHYSEEVKFKAVQMKQEGYPVKVIMDTLGIKNETQIKRWMQWYRNGETHRFSQPVGKQYSYNKGIFECSEVELLKLENRQLKARIAILAKFQEVERMLIEN